ncbi:MAG: GMC family oxidoreductase [Bdellovibrionota bacterium]
MSEAVSLKSSVRQYKDFSKDEDVQVDVAVIGSGAGGAVFANEMAGAGRSVLVVEEGRPYEKPDFNRDAVDISMKLYRQAGITVAVGAPGVLIPLGKTVGGTTTINSGTCFRTPDEVVEGWRKSGQTDVTSAELEPFFERIEKTLNIHPVTYDIMGRNNILFKEGADKLGHSGFPLKRNYSGCMGSGHCAFGCPENAKMAMNLSYIPMSIQKGAKVWADTRATQILHKNGKAVGLEAVTEDPEGKGRSYKVRVSAKIVALAGGTIPSPYFLLGNHLCNSSGTVGKNLRLHPAAKVMAMFEEPVYGWRGVPQSYCVDELHHDGITLEGFFVPPPMVAFALPGFGMEHKEIMANFKHLAGFGVMVHDSTAGRVRNVPFMPGPLIQYQINDLDFERFKKGVAFTARTWFAAGAKKVFTPFHSIKILEKPEEADQIEKARLKKDELELIAFHPMGTCQFGKNPKKSVVNPDLETHDLKNFFVVDGAVFPTSLGVNPQQSIMGFSMRAAARINENSGKYFA